MNDIPYLNWKSATFWSGLGMLGFSIFEIVQGDTVKGGEHLMMALAIIGGRRAIGSSGGLSG